MSMILRDVPFFWYPSRAATKMYHYRLPSLEHANHPGLVPSTPLRGYLIYYRPEFHIIQAQLKFMIPAGTVRVDILSPLIIVV